MRTLTLAMTMWLLGTTLLPQPRTFAQRGGAPPVDVTFDTVKGAIKVRLFPADAPKSVDQILGLIKRNFYRNQRIHRVEASLVQFGDPTSRDMSQRDWWGRRGSGRIIGVAEFNKRTHVRGAVSLAHTGDARLADSQLFIMKAAGPSLDKQHVVIGQVTAGMAVVDALRVTDTIKLVTVTAAAP
jgi:cyclophilin family peptidyl-prolyl cis-trans isomerase